MANVHSRWDKFELMLESHSLMIKEQIEVMKGGVESRKDALLLSVEKFAARWTALKPKDGALDKPDEALLAIGVPPHCAPATAEHCRSCHQGEARGVQRARQVGRSHCGGLRPLCASRAGSCAGRRSHAAAMHLSLAQIDDVRTDLEQTESVWMFLEEVCLDASRAHDSRCGSS